MVQAEKSIKFRIEKFNGMSFVLWKMYMEDFLYRENLFQPLNGKTKKPEKMTNTYWEVLDKKALGTIRLSLSSSIAFNISKEKTIEDLMAAIAWLYGKPSTLNKVFLMKMLFNMKMTEG